MEDAKTDLLASSSMCAEALQGMWVIGTGLDLGPEPSSTSLLFGWASWQIREVATAVCVTLFNYSHISGHGLFYIKHTNQMGKLKQKNSVEFLPLLTNVVQQYR